MDKLNFTKKYSDLYLPKTQPIEITIPPIDFIMIDGKGDPNDENGEYKKALELLYALCYTIKMSKMGADTPTDYYEYVVPPLEGLWWLEGTGKINFTQKDEFYWTSMIRQPEFVTADFFGWACGEVQKKKHLDTSKARFETFSEGLCVQCMHLGAYDDEPATITKINEYIKANALENDISQTRRHHEIYLSDPRRTSGDKQRTVLRIPVRKAV